jgi:hypothetical protein
LLEVRGPPRQSRWCRAMASLHLSSRRAC